MADNDSTVSNLNPNAGEQSTPTQDATQAMTPPAAPAPNTLPTEQSAADKSAIQTASTPQAGPVQNPKPATPPPAAATQQPEHQNTFDRVLGVFAGGARTPVRDNQGNPVTNPDGTVKTQPATVKQLGAGIVAGAVASLMAGFQHLPERNGNGIVTSHINEAAAAGAEAGKEQSQNARVQQGQQEADQQKLRQYQTIHQNYELQSMALQNHRLGDEALQRTTEQFQPLHDYLVNESANSPEIKNAILGDELGEDEMHQMMKDAVAHGVKDTAIPAGTRPEIGPDGKPTGKLEQTWMVLSNEAKVNMTPELQAKYGMQGIPVGTAVPLQNLMKFGMQNAVAQNVSQSMNEIGTAVGSDKSWEDIMKAPGSSIFRTPQAIKALQGVAGMPLDIALKTIASAPNIGPTLRDAIVHGFGITDKQIEQVGLDRTADEESAKRDAGLASAATAKRNNADFDVYQAGRKAAAEAAAREPFLQRQKQIEQTIKQGDPKIAGQQLVNHELTLSELKSRGSTPDFISQVTAAAKAIDSTYSAAQADAEFKIAGNQQNNTFFGNVNSLLEKGGTLDQMAQNYDKLGNGEFPLFNKWKDYLGYQAGDPAMAGYYQTALGVADDYAKVMGGGTGSDTSRLQVMNSFHNAHNPAQMAAAIASARAAVTSQKASRIGGNAFLSKMYGGPQGPAAATIPKLPTAPSGPQPQGATKIAPGKDAWMWVDDKGNVLGKY